MKPSIQLSNNACGVFLISIVFFVLLVALNHFAARPGTNLLLVLVGAIGVAALAVWTWSAFQLATHPRR